MRESTMIFAGAMALLLATVARPATADCLDGTRKTSEAERARHAQVGKALRQAFTAPKGWKKSGERPHEVPGSVCRNPDGERLYANYKVSYMEMDGAGARQEKLKAEMGSLDPDSREPGDIAAFMEKMKKMSQEMQRDTLIDVEVRVNAGLENAPGEPIEVPGGHKAFQKPVGEKSPGQMRTVVFLGAWKKGEDGRYRADWKEGAPVTAVQTAVVVVKAGKERTRSFLASSDLSSIAALVGK